MMSRLAKFTALATLVALVTLVPLASQAFEIVAPSKEWWWVVSASAEDDEQAGTIADHCLTQYCPITLGQCL